MVWWRWTGTIRRPPVCRTGALPAELHPQRYYNVEGEIRTHEGMTPLDYKTSPLSRLGTSVYKVEIKSSGVLVFSPKERSNSVTAQQLLWSKKESNLTSKPYQDFVLPLNYSTNIIFCYMMFQQYIHTNIAVFMQCRTFELIYLSVW